MSTPNSPAAGHPAHTRTPATLTVMAEVTKNQERIAALHADNRRLLLSVPGLAPSDLMTREERHILADHDFRVDRMTMDDLAPALNRPREKGENFPACISLHEAQLIFGYRVIAHGSYGELSARTSEKNRVQINVTILGR